MGFEKSKTINIRFPLWSLPLNESWEPPPFYGPLIKSPKSPMAQDLVLGFTCILAAHAISMTRSEFGFLSDPDFCGIPALPGNH